MKKYAFGVDIGGTTVKLGLFDRVGTLLQKAEIPTRTENSGSHILPDVALAITRMMAAQAIAPEDVAGIGLGVPGPVDAKNVVDHCVNLGWGVIDLKKAMNELLPSIPDVRAGNDANIAALGEQWQGAGKGYASAVVITLGTGIGSGVVLDGHILPGANGGAGEAGHYTVEPAETTACSCGKRGCLEQYASASGIVRLAKTILAADSTPSPLRQMDAFTARDICDLAREGDEMAAKITARCGSYLGLGLSYLSGAVDPEIFVIGGGMSKAGDVIFDPIRRAYRKYAFHVSANTPIVGATLGNDAGIYGGARLVLDTDNAG